MQAVVPRHGDHPGGRLIGERYFGDSRKVVSYKYYTVVRVRQRVHKISTSHTRTVLGGRTTPCNFENIS